MSYIGYIVFFIVILLSALLGIYVGLASISKSDERKINKRSKRNKTINSDVSNKIPKTTESNDGDTNTTQPSENTVIEVINELAEQPSLTELESECEEIEEKTLIEALMADQDRKFETQ